MSIISNNIKYLRRLNGLTQEQFSRRIGIKRSLLGAYEEARANPNYDNLQTIARIFGISIDDLIKNDLRRVRSTPDLLEQSQQKPVVTPEPEKINDPKPLSEIVDKFFKDSIEKEDLQEKKSEPVKPLEKPIIKPFEESIFKEIPRNQENTQPKSGTTVPYLRQNQVVDYLQKNQSASFLNSLSKIDLPFLPFGVYRGFEAGSDFAFNGAILIGKQVSDWKNIIDGKNYIVVLRQQGFTYRRVYNQLKIKGNLLLSADNMKHPTIEIDAKEVLEVWECVAFVSTELPQPTLAIDKLKALTDEIKAELERVR